MPLYQPMYWVTARQALAQASPGLQGEQVTPDVHRSGQSQADDLYRRALAAVAAAA
jgi:hypothetical protein